MPQSRTLILDTDIFVLIAGANLMFPLLDSLGCSLESARRLAPLPQMLERGRLVRQYPEGVREKASAWCEKIAAIEDRPPTRFHEPLLQEVDPGKALLFATVVELDAGVVATADKRACVRVATAQSLANLRPLLAGKVLCLEFALELLLADLGFPALAAALTPVRDYNRTLRLVLSEASGTSEKHFREGLSSYLGDLTRQVGPLLFRSS